MADALVNLQFLTLSSVPTWPNLKSKHHFTTLSIHHFFPVNFSWLMTNLICRNMPNMQQEGQWTYSVTLRPVHGSLLIWKTNKYYLFVCACVRMGIWMCVRACSLAYPACNLCPLWRRLWSLSLHHIFWHYHRSGAILIKKKLWNIAKASSQVCISLHHSFLMCGTLSWIIKILKLN
jgi:hypothetical protein